MIGSALAFSLSACIAEDPAETSTLQESSQSATSSSEGDDAPISTNGVGCNFTWSSPSGQCTGAVREWKGGCPNPDGKTYGGVGWSGNANQWWANAPAAYRTSNPGIGYIVVFGASAFNGGFGHVGVVTSTSPQVSFRSRNWKSTDYVGGVFEYLAACNCQLLGYLSYF